MTDATLHPLEMILRQCSQAEPRAWYPSEHARTANIPRDSLDPYLDQLRLGGLIYFADWAKGQGQGCKLTDEGKRLLGDASGLAQLRAGKIPPRPAAEEKKPDPAEPRMTVWEKGETVRDAVYEPELSHVARVLILVNLLFFAGGIVLAARNDVSMWLYGTGGIFEGASYWRSPERRQESQRYSVILHTLGGVSGPSLAAGEWWRLLSHGFVHMGFPHLALNMLSLFFLGRFAEKMWGPLRFLVLFLLSAMGGGALALVYDPFTHLTGASGGTCGILAAFGVWVFLNREHLPPETLFRWSQILFVNIILMASMGMFVENVSNTGHLGGAALGAILGGLLTIHRFGNTLQRWLAALGVVMVPALCVGYLYYNLAHDDKWRYLRHEQPTRAESKELFDHYLPKARRVEVEVNAHYLKEVFPLLTQKPEERDPQLVREALGGLRQARMQLLDIAVELQQSAGPYPNPHDEHLRLRRAEYLRVRADVLDQLMLRLEKGPDWTIPDRGGLEGKRALAAELDRKWHNDLNWILKSRSKADSPAP